MQALPQSTYFLLLEAAVGGTIALFWVHLRDEVNRGFTLFTGVCYFVLGCLALWLRTAFPPSISPDVEPTAALFWFPLERTLGIAFVVLLAVYLVCLRVQAWRGIGRPIGPVVPLLGLAGLWAAGLVQPSPQVFGLGAPLAVLAGAMALGSALTGLSLGHWYLVSPSMSLKPLIELTFACLGALSAQIALLGLLLFLPAQAPDRVQTLVSSYVVFFGVRLIFGLLVPVPLTLMTWRTARIRSLDSATGLLYIVVALVLAGEIAARTLYFLSGVAT